MGKLYYEDCYKRNFTANIINIKEIGDKYVVVLDNTYFYPISGGQPDDRGLIDGIKVNKVYIKDDSVMHVLDVKPIHKTVKCEIDWERRFDNMQQHTGQHLLSAIFYKLYDAETDSFSIGDEYSHITISNDRLLPEDIKNVEREANKVIYLNLAVKTYFVDKSKLNELPLRKMPKVTKNIRIVEIDKIDYSPCGGTHVKNTGEIGLIKIRKYEKVKNGMRIEFVCGMRALNDYIIKNYEINKLMSLISSSELELINNVNKLRNENKDIKKELNKIKEDYLAIEAKELFSDSSNEMDFKMINKTFKNRNINDLRMLSWNLIKNPKTISILSNISDGVDIIISRSDDVDLEINSFFKDIMDILDGRGGGSSKICQGTGTKIWSLDKAIETVYTIVKEKYKQK